MPFAGLVDKRVYVDSNAFVYFLERHPELYDLVLPLFEAAAQGKLQRVTSELTVAELLVQPQNAALRHYGHLSSFFER